VGLNFILMCWKWNKKQFDFKL